MPADLSSHGPSDVLIGVAVAAAVIGVIVVLLIAVLLVRWQRRRRELAGLDMAYQDEGSGVLTGTGGSMPLKALPPLTKVSDADVPAWVKAVSASVHIGSNSPKAYRAVNLRTEAGKSTVAVDGEIQSPRESEDGDAEASRTDRVRLKKSASDVGLLNESATSQ